jgi:hypothetical protein
MFLSELQSHTPSDPLALEKSGLTGLEMFERESKLEQECDISGSDTGPTSPVTNFSVPSSPPTLECMPTNLFTDPLDNPFLSNFTDISVLQETSPSLMEDLENPSPLLTEVLKTPVLVESDSVKVDVMESSDNITQQNLMNLTECIDLLTKSATPLASTPSSPLCSVSSDPSSPETPLRDSMLICDFDFSAVSEEHLTDLIAAVSSVPLHETPPTATPTGCSDSKTPRKRKLSTEELAPELSSKVFRSNPDLVHKHKVRRDKNNLACRVSRAKRKHRRQNMEGRVGELESENERLRMQEKELIAEITEMKKLLLDKLTHQKY